MPEFLELVTPEEAFSTLLMNLQINFEAEEIPTASAYGRITAAPIVAESALPPFDRSAVDGYAVRAWDTFGANDGLPAYLKLIGEIPMGSAPSSQVGEAQCLAIHTGGMLPSGSDAVVMLEHTQKSHTDEVEIVKAVAVGENIIKEGEDVQAGQIVIKSGTRLRPAEIGGLMALGVLQVKVARQPRVAIISSGDEVISPEGISTPGSIRDVNSYSLSALVEESGGIPVRFGIVPDNYQKLSQVTSQALSTCDLVVITAGSSASSRDLTSQVVDHLGEPGVLVHGINVKPGKPTILGVSQGKPVVGLPGNPVSALIVAGLIIKPLICLLTGQPIASFKPRVQAILNLNISSQAGREDWIPVRLEAGSGEIIAEPVFGKSNLIFTLSRADGIIRIPPESNGLPAGAIVQVYML